MPGFDEDSARRISKVVRRVEGYPVNSIQEPQGPRIVPFKKLGITSSAITARSSKTPGSGTVQPYLFNGSTLVSQGPTRTIRNWTGTAVATNKWVCFEVIDGHLFLDGTDCSSVAP